MSTRKRARKQADPQAEREARNYEHPVPSREAVIQSLRDSGEPLKKDQLCERLGVEGDRDREAFSRRLRAMERDGQLLRNRRGRYGLLERMDMVRGSVIGHPDGFGFLKPEGDGEDLYLSSREMRKVLHGDRVVGRVTGIDSRGRREGAIIEVVERRHQTIVGRYFDESNIGFVVPQDKRIHQDIVIPRGDEGGAHDGQIVVATLVQQPTARSGPVGRVQQVLGDHLAPGMETDVIVRMHDIPHEWPPEVLEESGRLGATVPEAAKAGRKDIRDLPLVTIDGEDSKDFDDAVFCERDGKGWRLVVAIADVSAYVSPDSALDREAYNRGTSVYFPNRVIPMLPESLSNGLCSINPNEDRLCMACDMRITAKGKIKGYEFYEAVMRSHARLTYNKVAAMLMDKDQQLINRYKPLHPYLENLYHLFKLLHGVRVARGAVDFDLPETRIVFNDNGKIDRIVAVERNDAHRLIEECMLAANVCAAEFLAKNKIPVPYRVHASPEALKLQTLREFLGEFGLDLKGGASPKAADYAAVLDKVADQPEARLIQTVMLRSLSQAIYSTEEIGHFALGYERYTHFTSPIRRYPDLMVHRAIKTVLHSRSSKGLLGRAVAAMLGHAPGEPVEEVRARSEHCSTTGRRADEASWDVIKWLKTEYMLDKVGESYDGVITGVTNFGLFIELKDIFVEGLVHVSSLGNDYYHFDPARHQMLGERTGQSFRLADQVRVQVVRVDLDEARIDFELEGKLAEAPHGKRGGGKKRASKGRRDKGGSSRTSKKKTAKKQGKKQSKKHGKKKTRSKKKKSAHKRR